MTGQFTVNVDKNKKHLGVDHWRVEGKINGRRIRAFFPTKEKADEHAYKKNLELEAHGHQAADLPGNLRVITLALAAKLERLGDPAALLTAAVDDFLARHDLRSKSVTVAQAWEDYHAAKEASLKAGQFRPSSLQTTVKVRKFVEAFRSDLVCDITSERIQRWLDGLRCNDGNPYSSKSKETYRVYVSGFFTYCLKRNWIKEHPTKDGKVDSGYRVNNAKRPDVLTLEQAAKLLEVADAEILPAIAIGLFAGLRPNEIHRLDWSDIHWQSKQIDVQAEKSKTAQYRFVPMSENLLEWLAGYRNATGRVFGKSIATMTAKVTAAGVAAGIARRPKDGLRHSYGSYYFAQSKNATETATHMGHQDTKMLFKHYNNRRTHAEGLAYFQIRPLAAQEEAKVLLAAA